MATPHRKEATRRGAARASRVVRDETVEKQIADAVQPTNDKNGLQEVLTKIQAVLEATRESVLELVRSREASAADVQMRSIPDAGFLPREGLRRQWEDEPVLLRLAQETGLEIPMQRLIALRNERYPASHPQYWGIVNFDLHSSKPRMFVFDAVTKQVESYLCAHGRGSEGQTDDGIADVFSNVEGSKASSLGIYRCAETYQGSNGYSLKLDGLQETNDRARSRAIVVHGADYVSEWFAERYGRIGRSEGCPVMDRQVVRTVIDQLKLGSLLMHWKTP